MNLAGMLDLVTLARQVGVDHWRQGNPEAARLRAALKYLVDQSAAEKWPHEQITPLDRKRLRPLLWRAAVLSDDSSFDAAIERVSDAAGDADRNHLLWPR
jgi:hypothetical protein